MQLTTLLNADVPAVTDRPLLTYCDDATGERAELSAAELGGWAARTADRMDLRAGDRLLVDVAKHEQPVMWLLAPLAAGASVVLCANLDPGTVDARAAAEGANRVL